MQLVKDKITIQELHKMAEKMHQHLVKVVIDIEQEIMMIDAEMHFDLEQELLELGSKQSNLWGINLHPAETVENFVEFDSMINLRPSDNNRSRYVENPIIRKKVIAIVSKLVGS